MAYKAELYRVLRPKLLEWHTLSSPDNLDELAKLFSGFARKPLDRQLLLGILGIHREQLDSTSNPDLHVISFEQVSKLFVSGVQATDSREFLEGVLDEHILQRKEDKKQQQHAGVAPVMLPEQSVTSQPVKPGPERTVEEERGGMEEQPEHAQVRQQQSHLHTHSTPGVTRILPNTPPPLQQQALQASTLPLSPSKAASRHHMLEGQWASGRDRSLSIAESITPSILSEDRHTSECSREDAALRRAAERQQEWCRYSLMFASREDGHSIGNATITAVCENLRQPSVCVKRRTLDDLEVLLSRSDLQMDTDSCEKLLSAVVELLCFRDRHVRRRAMCVLINIAPKGDLRVISILCPSRDCSLGLADEDEVVRGYAVRVLEAIAERGDKAVVSAVLTRVAHDPDPSSDVRYLAIRALEKLAQVGDAAVQKAMLAILLQPRMRIPARDTARATLLKELKDLELDEQQLLCASLAFEAYTELHVGHKMASDSLIRYRALRTLLKVATPRVRLAGCAAGAGLGEMEEGLLQAMHSHEDDSLVFYAAFSALCCRLGVGVGVVEEACARRAGAGAGAAADVAAASAARTGENRVRAALPQRGECAGRGGDGVESLLSTQQESLESIEFAHLELLAGGEGQGAQGSCYSSKEEVQYAVEVLKAWLAKREAKKEMRAAAFSSSVYGGGVAGSAKERLMDLKSRRTTDATP